MIFSLLFLCSVVPFTSISSLFTDGDQFWQNTHLLSVFGRQLALPPRNIKRMLYYKNITNQFLLLIRVSFFIPQFSSLDICKWVAKRKATKRKKDDIQTSELVVSLESFATIKPYISGDERAIMSLNTQLVVYPVFRTHLCEWTCLFPFCILFSGFRTRNFHWRVWRSCLPPSLTW